MIKESGERYPVTNMVKEVFVLGVSEVVTPCPCYWRDDSQLARLCAVERFKELFGFHDLLPPIPLAIIKLHANCPIWNAV